MSNESTDQYELPWSKQQTVLRQVDLRRYGKGVGKANLKGIWKQSGKSVLSILRAHSVAICSQREEKSDLKTDEEQ